MYRYRIVSVGHCVQDENEMKNGFIIEARSGLVSRIHRWSHLTLLNL